MERFVFDRLNLPFCLNLSKSEMRCSSNLDRMRFERLKSWSKGYYYGEKNLLSFINKPISFEKDTCNINTAKG